MPDEAPTQRVALGRYSERGHYDFATIANIVDQGRICHVGLTYGDQPVVMPTAYARIERSLYVHGSALAKWLKRADGANVCVTVSVLDALVLARSAYQHSLNFRSVVALGRAGIVDEGKEKLAALRAIVEHLCPGRWDDVRPPNEQEIKATLVLRVPLTEASAKIRSGPPSDFEKDLAGSTWAGLIPFQTVRGAPVPDPALAAGVALPPYLQ